MSACNRRMLLALALVAAGCGAAGRAGPSGNAPQVVAVPSATPIATPSASASAAPAPTSSAPLAAPPPRTNHGSGPHGCFTRAELAARQKQEQTDNAAAYVEALRRLGLRPVQLASHTLFWNGSEILGPFKPAHVEEREVPPHRHVRLIVMPPVARCGSSAGGGDFARGGNRVWLVKRHVHSRTIDVTVCGCPGCKCEQPDFGGCGGARIAPTTILGYELPAGTEFAGERELPYVEDFVRVLHVLPPQPLCKRPPPPP